MPDLKLIIAVIAEGDAEWVYILLVVVIMAIGWIAERVKSVMGGGDRQHPTPPRPRRHPTSLPRPIIPPLEDAEPREGRARPPVPPVISRPRPPVRPPTPAPRPTSGPPDIRRPGPPRARPLEERKAVIRGETAPPRPTRGQVPAPARPVPPPPQPAPEQPETWARLAKFGEAVSVQSKEPRSVGTLKLQARADDKARRVNVRAESLRRLTPADLQRAFVLKEILDSPLALRD